MEPFSIPDSLRKLTDPYPSWDVVLDAAGGGHEARIALARLWISEGIPYAFRNCPALYESVRSWLSWFLDVCAKEIGMVGSGRIGTSLNPNKFGKRFSPCSDLDLTIVSRALFNNLKEEFRQWSFAYESGKVSGKSTEEEKYWRNNNKTVPRNIRAGFLDTKYIPNHKSYPITCRIEQSMFLLSEKLKCTPNAPVVKEASIRCYDSWDSFLRQNCLNLQGSWERWKSGVSCKIVDG